MIWNSVYHCVIQTHICHTMDQDIVNDEQNGKSRIMLCNSEHMEPGKSIPGGIDALGSTLLVLIPGMIRQREWAVHIKYQEGINISCVSAARSILRQIVTKDNIWNVLQL